MYALSISLSTILDFGSSQLWIRDLASDLGRDEFHDRLRRRTKYQIPAGAVFVAVVVLALRNASAPTFAIGVLCLQSVTASVANGALAAVRALVSPTVAAWMVAAGNSVFLLSVLVAPRDTLFLFAALGATGSWIVTAALALGWLRNKGFSSGRPHVGNPWARASGFALFAVAVALQPADLVILGIASGPGEVAEVAAVSRWVQPIMLYVSAYVATFYPRFASARSDAAAARLLSDSRSLILVVCCLSGALFVLSPFLVRLILNEAYGDSIAILRVLAIWSIPNAMNQPLLAFLQARGRERFVAIATSAIIGLNLVGVALFASLGAMTVAVASLTVSTLLLVILWIKVRTVIAAADRA